MHQIAVNPSIVLVSKPEKAVLMSDQARLLPRNMPTGHVYSMYAAFRYIDRYERPCDATDVKAFDWAMAWARATEKSLAKEKNEVLLGLIAHPKKMFPEYYLDLARDLVRIGHDAYRKAVRTGQV